MAAAELVSTNVNLELESKNNIQNKSALSTFLNSFGDFQDEVKFVACQVYVSETDSNILTVTRS